MTPEADVVVAVEVRRVGQTTRVDLARPRDQRDPLLIEQAPSRIDPIHRAGPRAQVGLFGPVHVATKPVVDERFEILVVVVIPDPQVPGVDFVGEAE